MGGKRALLGTPRPFPQRSDTSAEHFIQTPANLIGYVVRNDKKMLRPDSGKTAKKKTPCTKKARVSRKKTLNCIRFCTFDSSSTRFGKETVLCKNENNTIQEERALQFFFLKKKRRSG